VKGKKMNKEHPFYKEIVEENAAMKEILKQFVDCIAESGFDRAPGGKHSLITNKCAGKLQHLFGKANKEEIN
jgi:hypothetical protein